jgi:hypothetical protein
MRALAINVSMDRSVNPHFQKGGLLMCRQPISTAHQILGLSCFIVLMLPAAARGQGSMSFNGTSSKLQNDPADLFDGSTEMTFFAWINPASLGEGNSGFLSTLALDGATAGIWMECSSGPKLGLVANFGTTDGSWNVPMALNTWSAIAISYDADDESKIPTFRVNFANVSHGTFSNPDGSLPNLTKTGYCIGNFPNQNFTWNGRIAHVQIFNRLLSVAEMDACLRAPGSIPTGLRLWLPMSTATDVNDRSGNGFHATGTNLTTGSDGPMVNAQAGIPPGNFVLPVGTNSVTQYVIRRFADGTNYPAGQLRGSGPATVIRATAATESLPSTKLALIITEDYDVANMSQWQNGTYQHPEYAAAVLCPVISDLTIAGYDPTGNNYANSGSHVNSVPWVEDRNKPDKYDLLRVRANGAEVRNVKLFACPGTAMVIWRDINPLNGQVREFDRAVNTISHVCFNRVFRGIDIVAVDQQVEHIEGTRWRDWGVKATFHDTLHDIHVYGGGDYGIWLEGDGNQLTDSYPESVSAGPLGLAIGLYVQGNQNVIKSLRSHHCATDNVRLGGSSNVVIGFWLGDPTDPNELNPLGFLVSGQQNQICNGRIDLKTNGTGIKITNGDRHTIRDVIFASYQNFTTTGIDADATLNNCTIDVLFVAGGVGLDLLDGSTGRLGLGNNIIIQAAHLGTTSELIDLPSTWDKSNRIVAGGMRLRGSITNIVHGSPNTTITAPSHGLQTGDRIAIGGAVGTNANSATGTYHTITYVNSNTFTIPLNGSGSYTAGTGYFGEWITK